MNPVPIRIEPSIKPAHSVLLQSPNADHLHMRIEALIQAQHLKLVTFEGTSDVELQSANGPKLSVRCKTSSRAEQQRVVWQIRAFIDAVEAAS